MGKTSKPIKILLIGFEELPPEMVALKELGHDVRSTWPGMLGPASDGTDADELFIPDIFAGPKCWRYLPGVSEKWLPQLLKEARAAQPPRPKKGKKNGTAAG